MSVFKKSCNFSKNGYFFMGFFLNHIYSSWKARIWRFPEIFCHQQKVVDHQSGQVKTTKSWNENIKSRISLLNLWKTSEMEFSDRGQYYYSISDRKNIISAQKMKIYILFLKKSPKSEIFIFCETTSRIFFDGSDGSNSLEITRFVRFRMSRYGLKKFP